MMALFWIEEGVVSVLVITGGVVGVVVTDWVSCTARLTPNQA